MQKRFCPFCIPHVQPVTRGFETNVSVQHSGRSPGLKIIASAIFPVSQWSIGFSSLITVTSSCRTYTCFPFHRSQLLTWLLRHLNTPYSIVATISQIFWNCNVNQSSVPPAVGISIP